MITLTLPISPQAWERVKRNRYGVAYVPSKTARFKRDVAKLAKGHKPMTGPLKLKVGFVLKRPKRPKFTEPAVRPDIDNYLKALCDGLNGVLYHDDAQICDVWAVKTYDLTGHGPRIEIQLEEMKSE